MGIRGKDLEEFLMQYPYLLRWVNECLCCHRKGYKPEMLAPDYDNSTVIAATFRRLAGEMSLDADGLCQQCRQLRRQSNS
jgi:hypothetical protein